MGGFLLLGNRPIKRLRQILACGCDTHGGVVKKASELGQLQEISAQNEQIITALVRITDLLTLLVETRSR